MSQYQSARGGYGMNKLLWKLAETITHDKAVRKVKKSTAKKHTLLTDEQVIEARRMYERDGVPPRKIAAHFGLTPQYTSALLSYTVRSKLILPREKDRA